MRITTGRNPRLVVAIVLGGVVLTLTDSRSDGAPDVPAPVQDRIQADPVGVRMASLTRPVPAVPAQSTLELPQRAEPAQDGANLFSRHSWHVAPPAPPPPPPAEPAPPTAPPLPFTFMGMYAETGGTAVYFLQHGDRVYDVRAGDVIDGTYAVVGESGGQLMLTYLPLDAQQGLPIGPAS